MEEPSRCIDPNELLEFAEGKLPDDRSTDTRLHLQGCARCRSLLAVLDLPGVDGADAPGLPIAIDERLGRYIVKGWLGAGGTGVVLRAHDPDLGRDVALKVIPASALADRADGRIFDEARHAARVTHPNVISVFDVGRQGERVFLAMELVEGESLARWLETERRDHADVLEVFLKAGRGLVAAHEAGIIHGDFKPANVLVGKSGEVKVSDFGLSRSVGTDRAALATSPASRTSLAGTPRYLAPERWSGAPSDARADQFSFAVSLYDAVFAPSAAQAARTSRGRARGHARLGAVLSRAMHVEPSARYPTMAALLDALEANRRRAWPRFAWGALALAAGLAVVAATRGEPHAVTRAPSIAAAPSAVDHDTPASTSEEASEAYGAALVAYHDGSSDAGLRLLRRALTLDPGLAAAHLRLALYGDVPLQERREHVQDAADLRTKLTDRDQEILGALSSGMQFSREAYGEYVAKLSAAARHFPEDAETALLYVSARARLTLPEVGSDFMKDALRGSAESPRASLDEAEIAILQGDLTRAATALDRCLAGSSLAASCLRLRAVVHGLEGRCEAMKTQALAMVAADPESDRPYMLLAMALAATGAPLDAVRESLHTRESLIAHDAGSSPRLRDEALVAIFSGDFATAEARLHAIESVPGTDYGGFAHEQAMDLLLLYEETKRPERAVAVAEDYTKKFAGWPHGFWGRARPLAQAVLRRAGRVSPERFREDRDDWAQEERDKNLPIDANLAWVDFYARPVRTTEEANEALAVLPRNLPLPLPKGLHWNDDPIYLLHREGIGRTLLLGGRPREALESLQMAARSCMGLAEPWSYVQANLELGEALEQTGDAPGACRAYAEVLRRWGDARPSSVSADLARKRSVVLHCSETRGGAAP